MKKAKKDGTGRCPVLFEPIRSFRRVGHGVGLWLTHILTHTPFVLKSAEKGLKSCDFRPFWWRLADSNCRPPACEDTMGRPDAAFRSFPALSAGCGRRISSHPLRYLRANFSACGSQCGSSPRNRGKFLGSGGLLYCNGRSEKDSYQGRS